MKSFATKFKNIFIISLFILGLGNKPATANNAQECLQKKNNSETYGNSRELADVIKFSITGNGYSDETIIRFLTGATPGFDSNYDAWKLFSPNQQVPSLYTKLSNLDPLSINALPELEKDWTIDIYSIINVTGNYLIEWEELGLFAFTTELYLEDLATGILYNLTTTTSFTINFPLPVSGSTPVFKLHVSIPVQVNATNVTCFGDNNGQVILSKQGNTGFNYSLHGNSGNLVHSGTNINETDTITGLAAGTYIIQYSGLGGNSLNNSFTITEPQPIEAVFSTLSDTIYLSEGGIISFTNNSLNAIGYTWNFGDGTPGSSGFEPTHTYNSAGIFTVTLTATNGSCIDMETRTITVEYSPLITNVKENPLSDNIKFINLGKSVSITTSFKEAQILNINIYNFLGQEMYSSNHNNVSQNTITLNLEGYSSNYYIIGVQTKTELLSKKIFIP